MFNNKYLNLTTFSHPRRDHVWLIHTFLLKAGLKAQNCSHAEDHKLKSRKLLVYIKFITKQTEWYVKTTY